MVKSLMSDIRSALFVPGLEARQIENALASGADSVIVDLEDAVAPARKDEARSQAVRALRGRSRPGTALRINSVGTPEFVADLDAALGLELDAIVVPKCDRAALVALPRETPPVWALIETAVGVREAFSVACDERVVLLMLGTVDLAADLGIAPEPSELALLHHRSSVVLDSRAAGIASPLDGVCLRARDQAAVAREASRARELGFGGKLCIHPDQVEPVNRAFNLGDEKLAWAREVLAASEAAAQAGRGAVLVGGSMVDRPVIEQARRLLRRNARRSDGE